jgi:S-formylglutathione hydrolase FrmB
MTVKTPHLRGRGDICLFVPPDLDRSKNIPVVILLHGVYGSAWAWTQSAGVHLQAMEMIRAGRIPQMIIAMPSDGLWGDGSGYLPHNHFDFEKWIAEDVVAAVVGNIPGVREDAPCFISGLSMGGFGALRIGAKYGRRFKGISAHSAITSLPQMKLFVEEDLSEYSQINKTNEDVFETIKKYRSDLPPIRFDCGKSDKLIEYNRQLHRSLAEAHIDHSYEEFPGSHEWIYWETYIGRSLDFFATRL